MARHKAHVIRLGNLPITARTLRALAYEYLRYELGCYMVSFNTRGT